MEGFKISGLLLLFFLLLIIDVLEILGGKWGFEDLHFTLVLFICTCISKFHQAISNAANDIYAFDSKSNFFFFF